MGRASTSTLTFLALLAMSATAQSEPVGTIQAEGLTAWANKMPPGPFSIHARGTITAPTPCHETSTSYEGDSKSNPPIYRVKVSIVEQPGVICIQKISNIPFAYDKSDYSGDHAQMEIFSDSDSKTVDIEIAQ